MIRTLTVAALATLLLALAAPVATAQNPSGQYPPRPGAVVEPGVTVITPRGVIQIQGRSFGPGTTVCIVQRSGRVIGSGCEDEVIGTAAAAQRPLAVATTDGAGSFTAEIQVPAGTAPGAFTVDAIGVDEAGESQSREVTITVVEEESPLVAASGARAGAGSAAAAPGSLDAAVPAVSILDGGNRVLLVVLILGALALLYAGPIRRRRAANGA
jgi:hypothetical protein